jgi:hypothetical protein
VSVVLCLLITCGAYGRQLLSVTDGRSDGSDPVLAFLRDTRTTRLASDFYVMIKPPLIEHERDDSDIREASV